MDMLLRGFLEEMIKKYMDEERSFPEGAKQQFGPIIDSPEDFMLGYIVGSVFTIFHETSKTVLGRDITHDELQEAFNIIKERCPAIKDSFYNTP